VLLYKFTKGDKMSMKKGFRLKFVLIVLGIIYVGYIFTGQQITRAKLRDEINKHQRQLEELKVSNTRLQDEVNMSKTDLYTEKLIRERLGLIREGETQVVHRTSENE
jgi:cell division protein FtsB